MAGISFQITATVVVEEAVAEAAEEAAEEAEQEARRARNGHPAAPAPTQVAAPPSVPPPAASGQVEGGLFAGDPRGAAPLG